MKKFKKKVLLTAVIIFLIAFGVRIVNIEIIKDNPFFGYPIMDEKYHDEWAKEIAEGHLFERIPFYRAPAYPYFLGLIYAIFGQGYYLPRLISIIIGALSCILIYFIGKELFSHKVGVLSALLACFYSMLLYFDSMLLTVNLEIFFCLLGIFWLLKWLENRTNLSIILAGVFWGLASITRPNFLIFVPVLAIYILIILKRESIRKRLNFVMLLITGIIPIVLPVILINTVVGKDFVLLSWNGGINFYLGNNQFAKGWTATSPEIDATWWGGYKDAIIVAEKETGKKLLPSQVSNYWSKRGFNYIFSKPFDWAILMLKKIYLLFNSFELPNNQSIQTFKKFSPLLQIPLLNFGIIIALAIWGFIRSVWKKKITLIFLFLLSYSFSIVIFFVTARYRMPLVPFLLIFASNSVFWFVQKLKERKQRQIVLPIIIIIAIIAFVHTDFLGTHVDSVDNSVIHATYGHKFFASGDYDKATVEYRRALKYDPKNIKTINVLGVTYIMLGRQNDARKLFRKSLDIKENADAFFKLGLINFELDMMDSAQMYFTSAIELDSTNPEIYYYAGMSYACDEKRQLAIKNLEASLQYHPAPKYINNTHYNLGLLYLEIGDIDEAKRHLLQAGLEYKDVSKLLKNTQ